MNEQQRYANLINALQRCQKAASLGEMRKILMEAIVDDDAQAFFANQPIQGVDLSSAEPSDELDGGQILKPGIDLDNVIEELRAEDQLEPE